MQFKLPDGYQNKEMDQEAGQVNSLAEAAAEGLLWKMLFLKISQYLHENTYVGVSS